MNNLDKPEWSQEIWNRINQAVHDECARTKIARKFLPFVMTDPSAKTFPADTVVTPAPGNRADGLSVDEPATVSIHELVVEFSLTEQQVIDEETEMTAVTLATRAANLISQAEDLIIFLGEGAINHPLLNQQDGLVTVKTNQNRLGNGLLTNPVNPVITVDPLPPSPPSPVWGENTTGSVFQAYANLQAGRLVQGQPNPRTAHYGPYFLVLHFMPFADTHAPLQGTLIMPADRIKALLKYGHDMMYAHPHSEDIKAMGTGTTLAPSPMRCHFYGTGTVSAAADGPIQGVFGSLGGNTMDLVIGKDATVQFLTKTSNGNFRFRVWERFSLRLKDPSSVIVFTFAPRQAQPPIN